MVSPARGGLFALQTQLARNTPKQTSNQVISSNHKAWGQKPDPTTPLRCSPCAQQPSALGSSGSRVWVTGELPRRGGAGKSSVSCQHRCVQAMGEISAPPWGTFLCKQELSTSQIPPPRRISSAGPELGPWEVCGGELGESQGCSGESEGNHNMLGMTLTHTRGDAAFSAAAENPSGARSEGQGRISAPDPHMNVSPAAQLSARNPPWGNKLPAAPSPCQMLHSAVRVPGQINSNGQGLL